MVKTISLTLISLLLGSLLTILTIKWQDEYLLYQISAPSKFGEITYQNLFIKNYGWNPAENVEVLINKKSIKKENIQESPRFDKQVNSNNFVGVYERIRRDEVVTIAFAYKGVPISPNNITIKSNRSIAQHATGNEFDSPYLDFINRVLFVLLLMVTIIFLWVRFYERKNKTIKN